jgi:hypothetical protein
MIRIIVLYFAPLLPFKGSSSSLRFRNPNVKHEGKIGEAVMARVAAIESHLSALGTEAAVAETNTEA